MQRRETMRMINVIRNTECGIRDAYCVFRKETKRHAAKARTAMGKAAAGA